MFERPNQEETTEERASASEENVLKHSYNPEENIEQIKEAIDQAKVDVLEKSFSRLDAIAEDIDRVKNSAVDDSVKEKFVSKLQSVRDGIKNLAARYGAQVKRFAAVSIILAAGVSEHSVQPDSANRDFEVGQDQSQPYAHTDSTTNALMDELARSGMPETLSKKKLLKVALVNDLINVEGVDSAEASQIMNQIASASSYDDLADIAKQEGVVTDESEVDEYMQKSLSYQIHKSSVKKERAEYEAIWEMHKRYGNPQVETDSTINLAKYNPNTNTIKIPSVLYGENQVLDESEYRRVKEAWIAELAHAKQFTGDREVANQMRWRDDVSDMKQIAEEQGVSLDRAHDKQYDDPGRIEYGAHEIIEPNLREELQERIDENTKKDSEEQK